MGDLGRGSLRCCGRRVCAYPGGGDQGSTTLLRCNSPVLTDSQAGTLLVLSVSPMLNGRKLQRATARQGSHAPDFSTRGGYGGAMRHCRRDRRSADARGAGLCDREISLRYRPEHRGAATHTLQPPASRRRSRPRLPLLSHRRRAIILRRSAADRDLHDLPFPDLDQRGHAGAGPRESRRNRPIHWQRVHRLPGYVYFDHSIHIAKVWDAPPATARWIGCPSPIRPRR